MFGRLACVLLIAAAAAAAQGAEPAAAAPAPAISAKDQETFDGLYKERIAKARNRSDKEDLAAELLKGAAGMDGGVKLLMLSAARELAESAGDLDSAVAAQEQIVQLKRGDGKAQLDDLVSLQLKAFALLRRKAASSRDRDAARKLLYDLGSKAIDNAIVLANLHRAGQDYAAAEKAERAVLSTAALITSPSLTAVRQGIQMSQTLQQIVARARGQVNLKREDQAVWEFLDAGLYDEAAKANTAKPDEGASLLIRVARDAKATPADVYDAAGLWDKRARDAGRGQPALEQIRLARAAELYERCLAVGEEDKRKIARLRLQAIHEKLGDLLGALRIPTEWVCLVDLKEDSAKVGFGSFEKFTVPKGPVGIAGTKFATGLGVHAPSRVVYSLRGQYKQLSVYYGMSTGCGGAAVFEILCDGRSVWKSPGMWSNHTQGVRKPVVLNIVGVDKLELVSNGVDKTCAGSFSRWGDPKVR